MDKMNQNQHDELATLFAQRMNFAPLEQAQPVQQSDPIEASYQQRQSEKHDSPIHYVSTHYTHTTHIKNDNMSESSSSPPPPYHEMTTAEAMAQALRDNSIDPNSLRQNQIHLFAHADYDQRLRLLELWRISPPSYPLEQHLSNSIQPTSLEQEESQARQRYEMQNEVRRQQRYVEFDTHIEPMSPIRDANEPAWPPAARFRAASIAASRPQTRHGLEAEPYMVNGYQASEQQHQAQNQALDPVYAAANGLWQAPSYAQAATSNQAMEDQYGAYQQIRCHADWEAMNEKVAREKFGMVCHSGAAGGGDVDMEL